MQTPYADSITNHEAISAVSVDDVEIVCYDREVPEFADAELERLYGSIFSSMTQFRIAGLRSGDASTYVARNRQRVLALILFAHRGDGVKVLNECMRLDRRELRRFVDYLFLRFPKLRTVAFNGIEIDAPTLSYPFQRYSQLEDIAMALPGSEQAYLASLGKNTRRNIRRYGERLNSAFPGITFEIHETEAVTEETVREIIAFNHARMLVKNKRSNLDEASVQRIVRMTRACGLVGLARIDGRICAGAISYRAGDNYFLDVLAHDPAYDDYWLGILCCYRTICACIARGGKEFHFLWGRYDYKFALGASPRELDGLIVYRSRLQMLRKAPLALGALGSHGMRRLKRWMDEAPARPDSRGARLALRLLRSLQQLKQAASG